MFKRKLVIVLTIITIGTILSVFTYSFLNESKENEEIKDTVKITSKEIDIVKTPIELEGKEVEEDKQEDVQENEEVIKQLNLNETLVDDAKEEVQVNQTTTFDNNYPDETNSQIPASVPEVIETNPIQEQTNPSSTQTAWERLGVSEYDYYNKPIFSWERVDFSVSEYGSLEAAYEACLNYGDNYEPYLNGQVLYRCGDVATLSGDYIGVMFSTEDLIY